MSRETLIDPPFNRPMAECDLAWLARAAEVTEMRALLDQFTRESLPVLNGSFRYSNFSEGKEHVFTFNPYRQWEYASLLVRLPELGAKLRYLDVGGAGSLLPYVLSARGHEGVALELNPLLVAVCQHVVEQKNLPLRAVQGDAGGGLDIAGREFDLVTMISVLEHVPQENWMMLLRNIAGVLRTGGWFYLTFDYGDHDADKPFGRSIRDIVPLIKACREAGLVPVGDDPEQLSNEWLSRRSAPDHLQAGRRLMLNRGPTDGKTPWLKVVKHLVKRLVVPWTRPETRYQKHNFFRLLLEKR